MANVTFRFAAPPGFTPHVTILRADTYVELGDADATEIAAPGFYEAVIDVGSYTGDVLATLSNPTGSLYGSTQTGQLSDCACTTPDCAGGSAGIQAVSAPVSRILLYDIVNTLVSRSATTPSFGAGQSDALTRIIRAVQDAIRALPSHKWKYYTRTLRLLTSPMDSATVNYTASTRLVVRSSGSWPADAELGTLQVDRAWYQKITRVNNTTLKINDIGAPSSNLNSVTAQWSRPSYEMSEGISELHAIRSTLSRYQLIYERAQTISWANTAAVRVGRPSRYTWSGSSLSGSAIISLYPHPAIAELFECYATVAPPTPKVYSYIASDVTVDLDVGTINSATGTFKRNMVGSFVYIATSGTSADAIREDSIAIGYVTGYTSKNELAIQVLSTTGTPDPGAANSVFISSPVDIEESVMLEYLIDLAYKHYCKNHFHKGLEQALALERMSFIRALEFDNRTNQNGEPAYNMAIRQTVFPMVPSVDNILP
jgi:hypothetical protein